MTISSRSLVPSFYAPAQLGRIIIHEPHNLVRALAIFGPGLGDGAAGPAGADAEGAAAEEELGNDQGVEAASD